MLGQGICDKSLNPKQIEGNLKEKFIEQISCGDYHMMAVTNESELFSWGDNK